MAIIALNASGTNLRGNRGWNSIRCIPIVALCYWQYKFLQMVPHNNIRVLGLRNYSDMGK